MKTICVIQPYVFPYLPYFQLAAAVDEFWVLDDVQFIRRGWMNRNRLLNKGGSQLFTLPVEKGRQKDLIKDKRLPDNFMTSLDSLVRNVRHCYARAPYRDEVIAILDELAASRWQLFVDFSIMSLRLAFKRLGIRVRMYRTSSLGIASNIRGPTRIIEICARVGADHYVNPIGGTMLYFKDQFAVENIRLSFIRGQMLPYSQGVGGEFVSGLSILDLLAWVAPEGYTKQIGAFELIGNS